MSTIAAMFEEGSEPDAHSYDILQSQELFSDSDCNLLTKDASKPNKSPTNSHHGRLLDSCSESSSSLFQTEITCTPSRTRRRQTANRPKPLSPLSSLSDSSDFEPLPKNVPLEKIFERFRKMKKKHKRKRQKKKYRKHLITEKKPKKPPTKKLTIPLQEKYRRLKERTVEFPFTGQKYLHFKRYLPYEQSVFGGFLSHIEKLKCDRHLQNSLQGMDLGEDLENESLEMHKYGYLDDAGPISPIAEHDANTTSNEGLCNYDAKIVENDSFILKYSVPSKGKWCVKRKKKINTLNSEPNNLNFQEDGQV
eukprot:XP_002932327.1 PREDICTED: TATA box-binding protein-associated factor RNA polymerase I subunit D [Xenopus tropicalis]